MHWREFHEPGGPLAFTYPEAWRVSAHERLELVSPAGSVIRWVAYRAPEDAGDEVVVTGSPDGGEGGDGGDGGDGGEGSGERTWQLARKRVVVQITYRPHPDAGEDEQGLVEGIVRSTRPAPALPDDARAFVNEVREAAVRRFDGAEIHDDGMEVVVGGRGRLDLRRAYRDATLHPHARAARVQQLLDLLAGQGEAEAVLADYALARSRLFPLLAAGSTVPAAIHVAVAEGIGLELAVEFGPGMHRITEPMRDAWGVGVEELRAQALGNLAEHYPLRLRRQEGTTLTLCGGHTFATGELLLRRLGPAVAEHLGEAPLVGIPARDVVALVHPEDEATLESFVRTTHATDPHPITRQIYVLREGELEAR